MEERGSRKTGVLEINIQVRSTVMGVELMCVCFLGKVRIKRKRKVETKIVVKNKYIRVESRN